MPVVTPYHDYSRGGVTDSVRESIRTDITSADCVKPHPVHPVLGEAERRRNAHIGTEGVVWLRETKLLQRFAENLLYLWSRDNTPHQRIFESLWRLLANQLRTAAYSNDLRWKMVYRKEGLSLSYSSIASNLNVDISTVIRVVKRFRETGTVTKKTIPN